MAKKKKRKKKPARGVEADERRRERLEARRQAKAEELARQQRAERMARLRRRGMYITGIVLVVWFVFFRTTVPSAIEGQLDDYEVLSFAESGVNDHRQGPVDYETSPPVSGPHAPSPAACGVHGQEVPDENLVHSLEHGAVGIFYKPDLEVGQIRSIEAIVGEFDSEVLSAPYPDMEPQIAVVSWAKKMELTRLDEQAIRNYISAFRGRGPEPGATCPNTAEQPFEPAEEAPEEEDAEEADAEEAEEGEGAGETEESP